MQRNPQNPFFHFGRIIIRQCAAITVLMLGVLTIPHWWCMRDADKWYRGDPSLQRALAQGVERLIRDGVNLSDFNTGIDQFNGEWLFGTYLMAGFGFGQLALAGNADTARMSSLMEMCIERMLDSDIRSFDRNAWNSDPVEALGSTEDHAAYLGYFNLLLGFHRLVNPDSKYGELNDRITGHLSSRLKASPTGLLETYPGEVYPVDNCAVIGSIGLHARIMKMPQPGVVIDAVDLFRRKYIDPESGLLIQAVSPVTGAPFDDPRASGTSLGLYLLSFADEVIARDLYSGLQRSVVRRFLGFGAVREYPAHLLNGDGDIDSGPIVLGYGLSATGFSIAGSRMFEDKETFRRLVGSAYLAGAPLHRDDLEFVTGGPLGNAILLAMLTAGPGKAAP